MTGECSCKGCRGRWGWAQSGCIPGRECVEMHAGAASGTAETAAAEGCMCWASSGCWWLQARGVGDSSSSSKMAVGSCGVPRGAPVPRHVLMYRVVTCNYYDHKQWAASTTGRSRPTVGHMCHMRRPAPSRAHGTNPSRHCCVHSRSRQRQVKAKTIPHTHTHMQSKCIKQAGPTLNQIQ